MVRVERGDHRGNFLPSDIILSRTYTGQPQTCTSVNFFCSHRVFVKTSEGESPVLGSGMWFTRNTACLTAKGPQSGVGDIRPMDCRMEHHGSGDGHDGANVALGNTIVMVGTNACKPYDLLEVGKVAREFGGGEPFGVVGEEFVRNDSCVATHSFEAFFGFERLMGVETNLMFNEDIAGGVVNKDTPTGVHFFKLGFAGGGE